MDDARENLDLIAHATAHYTREVGKTAALRPCKHSSGVRRDGGVTRVRLADHNDATIAIYVATLAHGRTRFAHASLAGTEAAHG